MEGNYKMTQPAKIDAKLTDIHNIPELEQTIANQARELLVMRAMHKATALGIDDWKYSELLLAAARVVAVWKHDKGNMDIAIVKLEDALAIGCKRKGK